MSDDSVEVITDYELITDYVATSGVGNYDVAIKYQTFDNVNIKVVINEYVKQDIKITSINFSNTIYNKKPVVVDVKLQEGFTPTMKFKVKGASDDTLTTEAPIAPGDYVCVIEADGNDDYKDLHKEIDFSIAPRYFEHISSNGLYYNVFQTIATGAEQELIIDGFDSEYMKLMVNNDGIYEEVDSLKATSGTVDFIISFTDEYAAFEYDSARSAQYTWEILDLDSIITNVNINGENYTFAQYLARGVEVGDTFEFTCVSGYDADIYTNNSSNIVDEKENLTFVVKLNSVYVYQSSIRAKSKLVDSIIINGESFDYDGSSIYYHIKNTDEAVNIEFKNVSSKLFYEVNDGRSRNASNLTLGLENACIKLYYNYDEGSYIGKGCIYIIKDNPIEEIGVVKYNFTKDLFNFDRITDVLEANDYLYTYDSFVVGFDVTLSDEYSDCTYRIIDRDTRRPYDFTKVDSEYHYVIIEVLRENEVIFSKNFTINNSIIDINGSNNYKNRDITEQVVRVSLGETLDVNLGANAYNEGISINGVSGCVKTYNTPGVYREKVTFAKEILGKLFVYDTYVTVICSEDIYDYVTDFEFKYTRKSSSSERTNEISSGINNYFDSKITYYAIENFDLSKVTPTLKSGVTFKKFELINDDTNNLTYAKITFTSESEDKVVYCVIPTDDTVKNSLEIEDNEIEEYAIVGDGVDYKIVDDYVKIDTATLANIYYMEFDGYVNVRLELDDMIVFHKENVDEVEFSFEDAGTYTLVITTRSGDSREITIDVDGYFGSVFSAIVGDEYDEREVFFNSLTWTNMEINLTDGIILGCFGEDSEDFISGDTITVKTSGALLGYIFLDKQHTNVIDDSETTFEVLTDDTINKKYILMYLPINVYGQEVNAEVKIYFGVVHGSPLALTVGYDTYRVPSNGFQGDFYTIMDQGEAKISGLDIDYITDKFSLTIDKLYDDYSYSIVMMGLYEMMSMSMDYTIAEFEEAGFVFRVTDSTLTQEFIFPDNFGPYPLLCFVLPEGTKGTDDIADVADVRTMAIIYRTKTLIDLDVNGYDCQITALVDDISGMFMSEEFDMTPKINSTADVVIKAESASEIDQYIFYVGELAPDYDKDYIACDFKSMLGLTPEYNLVYDTNGTPVEVEDEKIILHILEDATTGELYTVFYANSDAGKMEIKIIFDDLTLPKM